MSDVALMTIGAVGLFLACGGALIQESRDRRPPARAKKDRRKQ